MNSFCLMRYSEDTKMYTPFHPSDGVIECNYIPRIGEKVAFDIDGVSHVAEVIDVVYVLKNNSVDVYIDNERENWTQEDYLRTRDCKTRK